MLELSLKIIIGLFGAALVLIPAGAAVLSMFVIVFERIREMFLCSEIR